MRALAAGLEHGAAQTHRDAAVAVTGLAARLVRRGALIIAVVVAGMSAMVAATYRTTVGDSIDAASLAALAANPAIRTLFGEPVALDTAGGFTVWRTGTVFAVLVSVWALLAATRITRGEEEAGRWSLLLAGRLPMPTVVTRHLVVLAACSAVVGAGTAGALVLVGTQPAGAVLHGVGLALVGLFFAGAATLSAQVFPSRTAATGATAALLGMSLLLRMVGDGVTHLGWLRWLSPFGLVALTRPYGANRVVPLLVLAAAGAALFLAARAAVVRRDLYGGLVAERGGRPARLALLGSICGFAVRRSSRPVGGWAAGLGAYYLLVGLLVRSMMDFLAGNPRFAELAVQAGFGGLGVVEGSAATLLMLLPVPVGIFVAVRIASFVTDEANRRLTLLYAQPVTRIRLLAVEATVTAAGAAVLTIAPALLLWAGTAAAGAGLGLVPALNGALNVLPVVVLSLGAAVLALGWLPRAVVLVGATPAAGGFLLRVITDGIGAPEWVRQLSPFTHLAAVPQSSPDWPGTAGMLAVAGAFIVIGAVGYRRRDMRV